MPAEKEVTALLRRTVKDQMERWREEKESVDKRIKAVDDARAESRRLGELIDAARDRLKGLDDEDAAREVSQ